MRKSERLYGHKVAPAINRQIERSKMFGTFLAGTSFFGGMLLTANAANPNHFFNPIGLSVLLGSAALNVVELDYTKKRCLSLVEQSSQENQYLAAEKLKNEEFSPAKYVSSIALGFGANLGLNAVLARGTETGSTIAAAVLTGGAIVGMGVAAVARRESDLNNYATACNSLV